MTSFGANMRLWYGLARAQMDLKRIHDGGLTRTRYVVLTDQPRDYAMLDAVVATAVSYGLSQTMTLIGSAPPALPDPIEYVAVVSELAARYKAIPNLTLEIWNEPNHPSFWTKPNATAYAAMLLRPSIAAVQAVAPHLNVTNGGLVGADTTFLDGLRAAGAWTFSRVSFHPYTFGPPPDHHLFVGDILRMQAYLASVPSQKTVDLNEFGWSVPQWVTEEVRSSYLRAAASIAASLGVDGADVYCLGDNPGTDLTDTTSWSSWCAAAQLHPRSLP